MTTQTMTLKRPGASTMRLIFALALSAAGTEAAKQEIREAANFYEITLRAQWAPGAQQNGHAPPVQPAEGGEPTGRPVTEQG